MQGQQRDLPIRMPSHVDNFARDFQRGGFACPPPVLSDDAVATLGAQLADLPETEAVRRRDSIYGVRNLLDLCPAVSELATSPEIWPFVRAVLSADARAVRAIFFNKTADANWSLRWHQDSVIAVAEEHETPGYSAWACKAGVWQVRPPAEVLGGMLALRIHLDPCGAENGALRVLPGSHREGWCSATDWKARVSEVVCSVDQGAILGICPLLLHASAKAESPARRRVIHIEYAPAALPGGLRWRWSLQPAS